MSTRRWSLCLLFGPAALAAAQVPVLVPVPAIIKDVNEISDGSGGGNGSTSGAPRRTGSSLPDEIVRVGTNKAFFAATGDTIGRELWCYSPVATDPAWFDLLAGGPVPVSSDPRLLTPVGGSAFLAANVIEDTVSDGETVRVFRERLLLANGTSQPTPVALTAGPDVYAVQDIAPVGSTAIFALWSSNKTGFWRSSTTAAQLVVETNQYRMVGDMLDCGYDSAGGFIAFTSMPNDPPVRRVLVALKKTTPATFTTIHTGEVDNLTADGTAAHFTAEVEGTHLLYRWTTAAPLQELHASPQPIRHLMPAVFNTENRLYFVTETSGGLQEVYRAYSGSIRVVKWPTGTSDVSVTDAVVAQGIPHVLGTGVSGDARFWAIWRVNSAGDAMQILKLLPGWGGCSQLVANSAGKMAFIGHYHASAPDLRRTHLGFVTVDAGGAWQVTAAPIPDLSEGSVPSSLLALDTRVVFSAAHRLMGIEPWHCDFP